MSHMSSLFLRGTNENGVGYSKACVTGAAEADVYESLNRHQ